MNNKDFERRKHARFEIPGAFLSYKKRSFLSFRRNPSEAYCPVQNISQGGTKILCRLSLRPGTRMNLTLNSPEDNLTLGLKARLVWIFPIQARDFAFLAGIQFEEPCPAIIDLQKKYSSGGR
jgi:hypothetical protein